MKKYLTKHSISLQAHCMLIIPENPEAKAEGLQFRGQPQQRSQQLSVALSTLVRLYLKIKNKMTGSIAQCNIFLD